MAARVTGRPVRIALTREGVFRLVGGRTPSRQRVAIAADEDGKFTAFIHEGVTAQSNENHFPEQFSFPPRHLYAMRSYRIGQRVDDSRIASPIPSCARRASRSGPSPWRARSTRWRTS